MDADDRKLFEASLRHATELHTGPALDAALDDLGWEEALAESPRDAVSLLFGVQGSVNATSTALTTLLASVLDVDRSTTSVLLPWPASSRSTAEVAQDRVVIRGVGFAALLERHDVAVLGPDQSVAVVARSQLEIRRISGLDPTMGLVEAVGAVPEGAVRRQPGSQWSEAVTIGRVALAHELVGAGRTMLRLAREHALERVQFGRPIAGFQAIRHRLAEALVAIEAADAAAAAAWDDLSPFTAAMAKSIAGTSARTVARHSQQVLGGMGYTTEHPLYRYFRRVLVLDWLLGASDVLTREVGAMLLHDKRVPALLPL